MSPSQQVIETANALVAAPSWSPGEVAALLQVELQRFKKAPESTKQFVGKGNGFFQSVRLLLQTFGGRAQPAVRIGCQWEAQVTRAHLGGLIGPAATPEVHPPPAPGSQGPARFGMTFWVQHGNTRVGYGFESRNKSEAYLDGLAFERPLVALDPADFEASCFQAYQVSHAEHAYVIERRSSHHDAIVVSSLRLSERQVHVSFKVLEAFITETLAVKLIEELLLGDLLVPRLAGQYDSVEYFAEELESVTRRP